MHRLYEQAYFLEVQSMEEKGKLKEALAEVRQGRGQIVSLIGEAGVGKSRLVSELKRAVFTAEHAEIAEREGERRDPTA